MSYELIKELGWPIASAIGIAVFFWKGFWPSYTRQIQAHQETLREQASLNAGAHKEATAQMAVMANEHRKQLADVQQRYETRFDKMQSEFLEALKRAHESLVRRDGEFEKLVDSIDDLKMEIRDGGLEQKRKRT